MHIGYNGGGHHNSLDGIIQSAKAAEQAGLKSFWLSQILGPDSLTALAVIASHAPTLELGTSIVPLYGRHPVPLAAQTLTTQAACGGRLVLGIGPSHQALVENVLGESYAKPYTRTYEMLTCLETLLKGEALQHKGEEIRARGKLDIDAPPPPILIAALGPKMLKLAGEKTAGTTLWMVGPNTIKQHIAPLINRAADQAERPAPRVLAGVTICLTDDIVGTKERAAKKLAMYGQLPAYRAMLDREGVTGPADLVVAGSESAVTEGLQAYFDAGATELRVGALDDDVESEQRCLELLRRLVNG